MSTGGMVMALWWVAAIGLYAGCAIHLWNKPTKRSLERDEQDDQRSQRRY